MLSSDPLLHGDGQPAMLMYYSSALMHILLYQLHRATGERVILRIISGLLAFVI